MQVESVPPAGTDLREYSGIIRQRKWSIALVTLVVVATAVGLSLRSVPVYTSEARVLVLPTAPATSPFFFLATINMETEAGLVASNSVATLVATNLEIPTTPTRLLEDLQVSVEGTTEILDIAYTAGDPARAQRLAQGFAVAYLEFRETQARSQIDAQVKDIDRQIQSVSAEITSLQTQIDSTNDPAKKAELQADQEAQRARHNVLQQDMADVSSETAVQPGGEIVQSAGLPRAPSNENTVRSGILGVLVGLALGIALAFIREHMDDSLRGRDDLEQHLGAPVLAVVPKVTSWRRKKDAKLMTLQEPKSAAAEAYKTLRTGVLFAASRDDVKVIMVSSPLAGEGKTTTAANLGVALAQAGKHVALVSGDLRKPRIHRFFRFFKVEGEEGLMDVLQGRTTIARALKHTEVPGLRLLPIGQMPGNPAETLQSEAMGEMLSELRSTHDFVIVDSAPALAVADALTLAPIIDGVLFVADAQSTNRQAVLRARGQLEQVGARIIGGVLNDFDLTKASGSYQYRYYYRYGDGGAGSAPPGQSG